MPTRSPVRSAPYTHHTHFRLSETTRHTSRAQLRPPRARMVTQDAVLASNNVSEVAVAKTLSARFASAQDKNEHDTSDSSDSGGSHTHHRSPGSTAPRPSQKRPRKPTSTVRKEEKQALLEEIAGLEERAELLRARVGLPSLEDDRSLEAAQHQNVAMEKARRGQMLGLCRGHSILSAYMRDLFAGPLRLPIILGRDPMERRASLLAIRREKLEIANKYLQNRLAEVDELTPFADTQSWVSKHGDYCFHRTDVSQFEGVSIKHVFDAVMFYMSNMEISISEELGQLTLREDIDCVDTQISNHRIVSSTNHGVVVESNSVCFAEYHESFAERHGKPYAVMTNDSVDIDNLHPYQPETRVQRTINAAISLSYCQNPALDGYDGATVVVMRRCAYLCIKKPQFEVSQVAVDDLRSTVSAWGKVMTKTVRERAYALAVSDQAS